LQRPGVVRFLDLVFRWRDFDKDFFVAAFEEAGSKG
jgi:hypothetical protein